MALFLRSIRLPPPNGLRSGHQAPWGRYMLAFGAGAIMLGFYFYFKPKPEVQPLTYHDVFPEEIDLRANFLHPHKVADIVETIVNKHKREPDRLAVFFNRHAETLPIELMKKYQQYVKLDGKQIHGTSYRVLQLYNAGLITSDQLIEWGSSTDYYSELWTYPEVKKLLPANFDIHRAHDIMLRASVIPEYLPNFIKGDSSEFIKDIAISAFATGHAKIGLALLKAKGIPPTDDILQPKTKGFYASIFIVH